MENPLTPVTFEDAFEREIFKTATLTAPAWRKDGVRVAYLAAATDETPALLAEYHSDTDSHTVLTPADTLQIGANEDGTPELLAIPGYQFSPDESVVLFARTPRHRNFGEGDPALYLYHLAENRLERLTEDDSPYLNAKFSPDGTHLGYVKKNDLFVMNLATKTETRLTDTGDTTHYNGRFGWVYEEELDVSDGWAWSPDGTKIAFLHTDETHVPLVFLPQFDDLHQKPIPQRYPKAGDPNPKVTLHVVQVSGENSGDIRDITPATEPPNAEVYLVRLQWTPDNALLLQRIPRLQNRVEVLRVNSDTGEAKTLFTETSDTWIDLQRDVRFIGEHGAFLWISDRSGFRQIYRVSETGETQLMMNAAYDVEEIVGFEEASGSIYFTAHFSDPRDVQVCCVSFSDAEPDLLTPEIGVHAALFNNAGTRFLLTQSTRNSPPLTTIHETDLIADEIKVVLRNEMPGLAGKTVAQWERFSFVTGDSIELFGQMLKPADFDASRTYPVLLHVYGGPQRRMSLERYTTGYEQLLAASGVIVVSVDGRGSGGQGRDFAKIIYRKLGEWEAKDQISAAQWLSKQPFVDPKKIDIWGWSYGGYLTLLCLLRGGELFRRGVAVAPVTHWQYYDSIYTERYMRTPEENDGGYEASSPLNEAAALKSKLLLIHGTGDDNVHYQNSTEFALKLAQNNTLFSMMSYSAEKHGLKGVTKHLYRTMFEFLVGDQGLGVEGRAEI